MTRRQSIVFDRAAGFYDNSRGFPPGEEAAVAAMMARAEWEYPHVAARTAFVVDLDRPEAADDAGQGGDCGHMLALGLGLVVAAGFPLLAFLAKRRLSCEISGVDAHSHGSPI